MSTDRRRHRLSAEQAERLLRGDTAPSDQATGRDPVTGEAVADTAAVAGHDSLAAMLSDLRSPARACELSGQDTVMAAFRAAGQVGAAGLAGAAEPSVAPSRLRWLRRIVTRLLAIKVVLAVVLAGGVSGMVFAASAGRLQTSEAKPAPDLAVPAPPPLPTPGSAPQRAQQTPQVGHTTAGTGTSGPCDRFADRDRRGADLREDPGFRDLAERAGSIDPGRVDWFCGGLGLGGTAEGQPQGPGTQPGQLPQPQPSGRTDGQGPHNWDHPGRHEVPDRGSVAPPRPPAKDWQPYGPGPYAPGDQPGESGNQQGWPGNQQGWPPNPSRWPGNQSGAAWTRHP